MLKNMNKDVIQDFLGLEEFSLGNAQFVYRLIEKLAEIQHRLQYIFIHGHRLEILIQARINNIAHECIDSFRMAIAEYFNDVLGYVFGLN